MKKTLSLLKLIVFGLLAMSQKTYGQYTAAEILQKSIQVHDPKNIWEQLNAVFQMSIVRSGAADRYFNVKLNIPKRSFFYEVKNDSLSYAQGFIDSKFMIELNGKKDLTEAEIKKYDLGKSRTQYLREVYEYLLLLPMRLNKDKEFLSEQVEEETFNQKVCYKLTVRYQPVNENETWHFYIDKEHFLLHGYQFYLKDKATNGEYIYLEEYQNIKELLMPTIKKWYWNKDNSFFRTDKILGFK